VSVCTGTIERLHHPSGSCAPASGEQLALSPNDVDCDARGIILLPFATSKPHALHSPTPWQPSPARRCLRLFRSSPKTHEALSSRLCLLMRCGRSSSTNFNAATMIRPPLSLSVSWCYTTYQGIELTATYSLRDCGAHPCTEQGLAYREVRGSREQPGRRHRGEFRMSRRLIKRSLTNM